ncbi:hypothetical protein [Qipengyuania sphaerica]|uniref:hypothetical protein n=1 Tax=Qipengyuania sphaerica TaxID=2867243 RepID=UPI001C867F05|nr:hypothetical protein [Qipengyuania sphaerica]MBX7540742.1 hypothetical protein [Qipengyuania sphaerica]
MNFLLDKDAGSAFVRTAYIGFFAALVLIWNEIRPLPDAFPFAASAFVLGTLVIAFWRRKRDEYTFALWTAGASMGFGAFVLFYFGGAFIEGVYDGATGRERQMDFEAQGMELVAITTFYLAIIWKHLRGGT